MSHIEEHKVATRFMMTGTYNGTFFGVPPTGKESKVQALNFYRFANGQIIDEYAQPDMPGLLQQIGTVPGV